MSAQDNFNYYRAKQDLLPRKNHIGNDDHGITLLDVPVGLKLTSARGAHCYKRFVACQHKIIFQLLSSRLQCINALLQHIRQFTRWSFMAVHTS